MTLYEFLLFVHVAAAVVWVGGAAMIQFFGVGALASRDPNRLAQFGGEVERIGNRVLVPAALTALLAGFGLVWEGEFVKIGDDWIVIGLILFAISFVAGAAFFGPESGRIKKLIEAEGPVAAAARIRRLIVLTRFDLMLLFLIVFDMTVKPSFDDVGTLVGAVLVAAALAALITVPTIRARTA
jgi:uncharacterized membrane protein